MWHVNRYDDTEVENTTCTTFRQFLKKSCILTIRLRPDGRFELTEACDDHFTVILTAGELQGLGAELIQLGKEAETERA